MNLLMQAFDLVMHLNKHLPEMVSQYGHYTYGVLFLIIFSETGLVVLPFLPGDSLLFAAGAITGMTGGLQLEVLLPLLIAAAILGDTLNYSVGRHLGHWLEDPARLRWVSRQQIARTEDYFRHYGTMTIIIARFIPLIRTFAPFLAGTGRMHYPTFLSFNIAGGLLWVCLLVVAGHFFGNLPLVRDNFSLVVIGIIIVSLLPLVYAVLRRNFSTGGDRHHA